MNDADLDEAQAMSLYSGLRGVACEFSRTLNEEMQNDITALSGKLRERFSWKREEDGDKT